MAHSCRLVREGGSVDASWRRESEHLIVSPQAGPAQSLALGEASGIAGDGFAIVLHSLQGDLRLERLGADGPTLLQDLRRDWLPLRAGLLRLCDGTAPAKVYSGRVQGPLGDGAMCGYLAGDRFIHAVEGGDVTALLLADVRSVEFDEATFSVRCAGWDGRPATLYSRLAGETAAFTELLTVARGQLTAEAEATLAAKLPSLAPAARARLSAHWLPGRMLSVAELEALAPGFEAAFGACWLAHSERADEGRALMQGLAPDQRWLAYARPGRTLAPGADPDAQPQLLWLLVRGDPHWSLELLSQGDYATYLFKAGAELPSLVGGLVQFPEFSREALYMPMADLVEERSRYTIAARDLPLLRDLRSRFAGRRIHAPRARPAA